MEGHFSNLFPPRSEKYGCKMIIRALKGQIKFSSGNINSKLFNLFRPMNEPPTCMYCSRKGHRSKKCYSKEDVRKRCCINCSSSSDPTLQNDARSHNSASDICPLMIRETKSLMNKTLATNESKNEYLRKMMMKKEQQRCFQRY